MHATKEAQEPPALAYRSFTAEIPRHDLAEVTNEQCLVRLWPFDVVERVALKSQGEVVGTVVGDHRHQSWRLGGLVDDANGGIAVFQLALNVKVEFGDALPHQRLRQVELHWCTPSPGPWTQRYGATSGPVPSPFPYGTNARPGSRSSRGTSKHSARTAE